MVDTTSDIIAASINTKTFFPYSPYFYRYNRIFNTQPPFLFKSKNKHFTKGKRNIAVSPMYKGWNCESLQDMSIEDDNICKPKEKSGDINPIINDMEPVVGEICSMQYK